MKIEWNVNPLATKVFLDDSDRKYLRLAVRMEAALSALSYHSLREKKESLEDAARYTKYINEYSDIAFDEDSVADKLVEEVNMYELELQSVHLGDCICFACSCMKCRAEDLLGISTIKGLGQHEASKIDSCFLNTSTKPWSSVSRTATEVVQLLSIPISREKNEHWKNQSQEAWDACIPRWEAERERALRWYQTYAEEHGFL